MDFDFGDDAVRDVTRLIERAERHLYLITPYVHPWQRLVTSLKVAHAKGVKIVLVLRGGADRTKQEANAAPVKDIAQIVFAENLHAKIYLSEREAVVSSMNLLESSMKGSWEFSVRLDREADAEAYDKVRRAIEHVAAIARVTDTPPPKAATKEPARRATEAAPAKRKGRDEPEGHCIGCGDDLSFNVAKPFCRDCYTTWAADKDEDEKQVYCHACGNERSTTLRKPLCRRCYDDRGTSP